MAACLEIVESTKVKLGKLSCPFTWELLEMAESCCWNRLRYENVIEEDDTHFYAIMHHLLKCYESVMSADTATAEKELEAAEECLERIQEFNELQDIIRTIEHILYATKCHFLYEIYNEHDLENLLQDVPEVSNFTDTEHGALQGFKSIAFTLYYDLGVEKAIVAASIAAQKNEQIAVWHYILAKNLRRKRRQINVHSSPVQLEKDSFERAFMLSKSPTYGIYYAQMKHETAFNKKVPWIVDPKERILQEQLLDIYNVVLDSKTKNWKLLLKAALGYLRISHTDTTFMMEQCLNAVDKLCPNNPAALHYRGLLYKRRKNNKEALKYFKQAADLGNFVAEINYVELGCLDGSVDPVNHLLGMLIKYNDLVDDRLQKLYLQIGTSYIDRNRRNAAKYFLKAIDVAPEALNLTCFFKFANYTFRKGIYYYLQYLFLPSFKQENLDPILSDIIDQLDERCRKHFDKSVKDIEELLHTANI